MRSRTSARPRGVRLLTIEEVAKRTRLSVVQVETLVERLHLWPSKRSTVGGKVVRLFAPAEVEKLRERLPARR